MVKLARTDDIFYRFTFSNGSLLEMRRRPWGTYILGSWIRDGVNLTGGGTDMEYVFRAGNTPACFWFSGGNHGNECMDSIEFFDDKGEKFDPDVSCGEGEYITVVQKTRLFCDENPDKIDYSDPTWPSKYACYCNVTRTYTISENRIHLFVDYDYIRDVYLGLSYTAMFPIIKTHGLYCSFYNGDELLETVETSKVGKADYSGPFLGKQPADRVVMWGYLDPKEKVEVRIYTPEDSASSFRGSHKTFFWDMNTTHNKLYFSMSSLEKAEKVMCGTKRHTETTWTLINN